MITWLVVLTALPAFAADRATVILLRGTAKTQTGQVLSLKDVVDPGTTITTEAKSFVKLLFADQTQMNIGPGSTMKIEATKPGEVSLVSLVAGQIRAKVSKDPLANPAAPKDKLVIKTRTAAMGIRGTDFNVSYNPANRVTALITFEGHVAMANLNPNEHTLRVLADDSRLQHVGPGQYSGSHADSPVPTVPVRISPVQLEALRENDSFRGLGEKPAAAAPGFASPVPPGVDPRAFSSDARTNALPAPAVNEPSFKAPPAEGFYDEKTKSYAPRSGGFVDLGSGRYLPPPAGAAFDANTNTYLPPKAMGEVDLSTGMYVPPKGVELDPVKGFVPETGANGRNPSSAANQSAAALNQATKPEQAGKQISFDKTFAPTAAGTAAPPPPPPSASLPPVAANLPPPPREPVDDAYCPLCVRDNVQSGQTETKVRFLITTQ
jgi:hypothetical protein